MFVRDFEEHAHLDGVMSCVIELQDYERLLDPRLPSGRAIVSEYIPQMLDRCEQCNGKVLVAEVDGEVAGYATVLARVSSGELADGDVEYGLVADLVVAKKFRNQGHGRRLLEAAESYARAHGVIWLRVNVLAGNRSANDLYTSMGFSSLYLELEKDLTPPL